MQVKILKLRHQVKVFIISRFEFCKHGLLQEKEKHPQFCIQSNIDGAWIIWKIRRAKQEIERSLEAKLDAKLPSAINTALV